MNSLANSPQPCICERPCRQQRLKADGFLKEREDENLNADESNSASKEELFRRNEARALRRWLGVVEAALLLAKDVAGDWIDSASYCTSGFNASEPFNEDELVPISERTLLGWRIPEGRRRAV